jgi:hypothetical protein
MILVTEERRCVDRGSPWQRERKGDNIPMSHPLQRRNIRQEDEVWIGLGCGLVLFVVLHLFRNYITNWPYTGDRDAVAFSGDISQHGSVGVKVSALSFV